MTYLLVLIVVILVFYLYFRKVWFYRRPKRYPPEKEGVIISPADGQIVYLRPFLEGVIVSEKLEERIPLTEITKMEGWPAEGWIIGIYMSPLDVHYNYAPIKGQIKKMFHLKTQLNLPMLDLLEYVRITFLRRALNLLAKKFHLQNERNVIFMEGELKLAVVEIADKYINKIRPLVSEGAEVEIGQEIGFIDRGSQVDLIIFNRDIKIAVRFGQQVFGGKTILARYRNKKA